MNRPGRSGARLRGACGPPLIFLIHYVVTGRIRRVHRASTLADEQGMWALLRFVRGRVTIPGYEKNYDSDTSIRRSVQIGQAGVTVLTCVALLDTKKWKIKVWKTTTSSPQQRVFEPLLRRSSVLTWTASVGPGVGRA